MNPDTLKETRILLINSSNEEVSTAVLSVLREHNIEVRISQVADEHLEVPQLLTSMGTIIGLDDITKYAKALWKYRRDDDYNPSVDEPLHIDF